MSASHPKATESLRSSEMTLSANSVLTRRSKKDRYSSTSSAMESGRLHYLPRQLRGFEKQTLRCRDRLS
jgi:hypothetical protein